MKEKTGRTKIRERALPQYSKGEELFNFISHTVGGAFGIFALTWCVITAVRRGDAWSVISGIVYGISMIVMYTMSAVYHGLRVGTGKKVMQVLDHCAIYLLIGGSYTPITLCAIRRISPAWCWALFGAVWALAIFAIVFTSIDLKKYRVLSMCCYIGMGWAVAAAVKPVMQALSAQALIWLAAGGLAYSVGAVLYGAGRKKGSMHCLFHVFVLLGSICHFICIALYILPVR